jgi:hypothetical protein
MMKRTLASAAIVLAALISACSGSKPEGGGSGQAITGTKLGGWNVLDACAKLDKTVLEQSLGGKVQSAELSAVHDGSNGGDLYSQCVYNFGGLDIVVFGTGESAGGSASELAESMRAQIKQGSDTPTEDVPGLGEAAIWNAGLHQLYVFVGDHRFFSLTMGRPGGTDQKAAAVALARKLVV